MAAGMGRRRVRGSGSPLALVCIWSSAKREVLRESLQVTTVQGWLRGNDWLGMHVFHDQLKLILNVYVDDDDNDG